MPVEPRSGCAINAAVEVLGDNWSLIVLRDIIFGNRRHFRELLTSNNEGIASNMLSSRLKKLVDEGLLTKAEAVRGQKAKYSLTEAGIQTLPVMVALGAWGMTHRETSPELTIRARLMAEDPQLVSELMDELREAHLGVPRPNPDAPRASQRLQAAYEAEISGSRESR
ncbi:winged helix-turn-helix transcriptional regulator [Brevibacterium epidermidis]|uniref:winged helix-turn-helix transcriptional regulator n=1 Tax=Brevibacterium epidermidis TaxID=1698 RepID=UPI000BF629FD|nr:helix-turn-helix domain-containing protein [Brevibacterium epidermidis]